MRTFFIIARNVLTAAARARNRRQLYVKLRVYDAFSQDLFGIFLKHPFMRSSKQKKKSTEEIFASRRAAAFLFSLAVLSKMLFENPSCQSRFCGGF